MWNSISQQSRIHGRTLPLPATPQIFPPQGLPSLAGFSPNTDCPREDRAQQTKWEPEAWLLLLERDRHAPMDCPSSVVFLFSFEAPLGVLYTLQTVHWASVSSPLSLHSWVLLPLGSVRCPQRLPSAHISGYALDVACPSVTEL